MSLPVALTSAAITAAVFVVMALEAQLSAHNEHQLRARGALEPADDVFPWMRVAYPLGFLAMGVAGAFNAVLVESRLLWGFAVLAAAKGLKYWAIAALGPRWSFRVLVVPGAPLVSGGPYRYLRHPNYVAVLGELAGVAIAVWAPVVGAIVVAGFAYLIWQRIGVEERALGIRR